MHFLTADITDGIQWLAELIPFMAALLGLLLLFELAILLGAVIATPEERAKTRRSDDEAAFCTGREASVPRLERPAITGPRERSVRAR